MLMPRRLALSASILNSICGVSNFRSVSVKMKRPLFAPRLLHLRP